jgi:hypothetical protein
VGVEEETEEVEKPLGLVEVEVGVVVAVAVADCSRDFDKQICSKDWSSGFARRKKIVQDVT